MGNRSTGLTVVEHPNYEAAVQAASSEAGSTMAATAPAVLYRQAGRTFIVTAFPLRFVSERVRVDDLRRGEDPDQHYNRPIDPAHSKAISVYLQTEPEYILPPLSLCVQSGLRCHVPESEAVVKLGTLVLPVDVRFSVTDGAHRVKGITDALRQLQRLSLDGVAATIVCESNLERVHRDFYDCSQSRPISPSLLTAFNGRDPLARLVKEVCETVSVFQGRIEKVAKSVGKSNVLLFTMNQVKQATTELVLGSAIQGATRLRSESLARLTDDASMAEHRKIVVDFFEAFTIANPEWFSLLGSGDPATATVDTAGLREQYVSCTATGLVVLGRVGYAIRGYQEPERGRLMRALANGVDWSRSAEIWRDNIVTAGGKMMTQRVPVELAAIRVKQQLGLPLSKSEQNRLQRMGEATAA